MPALIKDLFSPLLLVMLVLTAMDGTSRCPMQNSFVHLADSTHETTVTAVCAKPAGAKFCTWCQPSSSSSVDTYVWKSDGCENVLVPNIRLVVKKGNAYPSAVKTGVAIWGLS